VANFDVLIAGAGPAGCAAALSLADFAPELRVGLIDPVRSGEARIGETVPPQIRPLLAHLGVWDEFAGGGHSPSYRTIAAWGDSRLGSNEFLFHTHQVGWRLDRAAFDRMLVTAASARVKGVFKARVVALAHHAKEWLVSLSDGAVHSARYVVDASGRAAVAARQSRLRPENLDHLVGCCLQVASLSDGTEGLMIESFAQGWWYTSAIPGGGRVVACMTDADLVRALGLAHQQGFAHLVSETKYVRQVADITRPLGPPIIWPAGSRRLMGTTALPLLCVGDASLRYDPLSGQGIVRALRSGIFGSYAIADWLRNGDARGLFRYRLMLQHEFAAYCEMLRDYYSQEQRWADRTFWRRRNSGWPSTGALSGQAGCVRVS
jgi:2-polyprenyl-6-methoxyphenol hydroxylase-like FAD-dependent oxidoreductase